MDIFVMYFQHDRSDASEVYSIPTCWKVPGAAGKDIQAMNSMHLISCLRLQILLMSHE
jgi:hypothetical protein